MMEPNPNVNSPTPTPATARKKQVLREFQDEMPRTLVPRPMTPRAVEVLEHVRVCARIADDNRGKDVIVLDMRTATPILDYFVIATASSRRLSSAIASEIDQEMKRRGERKLGLEGSEDGRWVLIDYGAFVVHVFSAEARAYYALEDVWGDTTRIDWQDPDRVRPAMHTAPEPEPELEPEAGPAGEND